MLRFKSAILVLGLSVAACGTDDPQILDASGGTSARTGADGRPGTGVLTLEAVDGQATAEAGTTQTLRVRLSHTGTGRVVDATNVAFELVEQADSQTTISTLSAITDAAGIASVDLRLGPVAGRAVVRASHAQAATLDLPVNVTQATAGTIRVDISDPPNPPVQLAPYRASFYEAATLRCDAVRPRERLPDPLVTATTAVSSQPVMQPGMPGDRQYTVVVDALGNGGLTLAQGCVEGVSVSAGSTTVTTVRLAMVPIQPSGTFDVNSTWDFSEALASQNSTTGIVVNVIEFMANPGEAIYEIVLDEVEDAVGISLDLILDIVGVRDRVIDYVNGQLFKHANIETFVAMSADLSTMLNQLEVQSRLTIDKTDAQNGFTGREDWTHITVHWTWKCQESSAPDCGQHTIDIAQDGFGAVNYEWTGRVDDYDQLVLESHQATIDTGELVLFLLENVMIPELTGGNANSMGEAMAYWVDCGGLAQQATEGRDICDPTGFFCIGRTGVEAACELAIGELTDYLIQPLSGGSNAVNIQLNGTATLQDASSNGVTDAIVEGTSNGILNGTGEPVTVSWSAARP